MKFILSLSRKVKIIIAACAVAVAAVVGAVIILNSEEAYRVIKVFELNGSAMVARENTGDIDAYAGMNLENGDVLSVEKSSTMQLSLDSDKYILLDGGTVLKLIAQGTAEGSKTVIDLMEGTILNEIKNSLSANSSYEVNTPKATIAVRGTIFKVTTQKNSDGSFVTDIYTTENTVSVQLFDENGNTKGEEIYVPSGGAVTILTEVNNETGNSADVDGEPHFVFRADDGSLTDCEDNDPVYYPNSEASAETPPEQSVTSVTTAAETTETSSEAEEEEEPFGSAMSKLRDVEIENKEIKLLAHYDINPASGESKNVGLELLERKYGGYVTWIPITWNSRYDDLSANILSGTGVDIFPSDSGNLPKGIISGTFEPVDQYIDINDDIWANTRTAMENYKFGDEHFMFVTDVTANYFVYYNTETIKENGMEDPWELYKSGKWNWDTFKSMLTEFVDEDKDRWGLDNWYNEAALAYSAGAPAIKLVDGHLVCNIRDAALEKAMNFQYDLYSSGLVLPIERFDWTAQPQMMGEKRELFWIGGSWETEGAPETWPMKIPPENLGIVPTPSPAGSEPYQAASLDGYVLCKGAANPVGAALFAECTIISSNDESARVISRQNKMKDAQWSEELVDRLEEINSLAKKYPVIDLAAGCSNDIASITTDGGNDVGIRAAFHGTEWAETREAIADTVEMLVNDVDTDLQSKVTEFN
ncbi:MAG: extracellular solute-binding protein [Oscillospiraceae bacterium]|nr:extracellular solute-binding protein [Oscillospiraceae bacterium]